MGEPQRKALLQQTPTIQSRFLLFSSAVANVRLESLKLVGFKSFPDEVLLTFPSAVSAILGPNGSGKSNLVDAMLWVLGEQSPSLLRLKNMGDVVFSGSGKRRPAGSAEVRMVLRSQDSRWEENGGRLEIRRRVLRSGPSEYRMNGKAVRLKDIADELLAVGLGTRSYSIIEQGKIGQVLSARPTDRRVLIEEAAGITRYKVRKHDAALKLERTRQNLLRLDDVLDEVNRSLRQLKRQARQAEKYQHLQEELTRILREYYTIEARDLHEKREEISRRRGQILNEVAAAASSLGSSEADLAQAKQKLESARRRLEELRGEISRLDVSQEGLEAFLKRSEDLLENLNESLSRNSMDERRTQSELSTTESASAHVEDTLRQRRVELAGIREELEAAIRKHREKKKSFEKEESRTARLRKDLLRRISSLSTTRNRLSEVEREQDRISYSSTQLDAERQRLKLRLESIDKKHGEAMNLSAESCRVSRELDEMRAEKISKRNQLRLQTQQLKETSEQLSGKAWEERHRLTGIERELSRINAALEKVAAFLPPGALLGRIGDFLDPEAELVDILDRIFSDLLEMPVLKAEMGEKDGLDLLADFEDHLSVVFARSGDDSRSCPALEDAESLWESAGFHPDHISWLSRTLPPAYRCADPLQAQRLALRMPEIRVIDGQNRIWSGAMVRMLPQSSKIRGSLALEKERRELKTRIGDLDSQAEESTRKYRDLMGELSALEETLTGLDRQSLEAEQERARRTALEESLKREKERLYKESEALEAEVLRNTGRGEELRKQFGKLETELRKLEEHSASLEREVEDASATLDKVREELGEALRSVDLRRAEERLGKEREEAALREEENVSAQKRILKDRLKNLEQQRRNLHSELEKTRSEIVRSKTRLVEEQAQASAARRQESQLSQKTDEDLRRVEVLELEVRRRRSAHDSARDGLHRVELEQAETLSRTQRMEEQCKRDISLPLDSLLNEDAPMSEDSSPASELLEAAEKLRGRVEAIGPVNLLALDELSELSERREFLGAQRKDLQDALKSLDQTIAEIDADCRQRFLKTFEEVNTVFGETFSYLFGGGQAGMELVDEDQPLESGLDIIAQPPGKKNQSVQLLSGGEKALTALALLISLFRIKPSPFCILDEVDAPLDDANVERLGELVRSMTHHTQFILITHNRRTMQSSDILYGVTMEEPGVSKIVSARLDS